MLTQSHAQPSRSSAPTGSASKPALLQGMFVTSVSFVPGTLQFTPDEPAVLDVLNNVVLQQALSMAQARLPLPRLHPVNGSLA